MLKNEIKVVNKLINIDQVYSIGENRLRDFCRDYNASFKIVVDILENEYNAFYVPSPDPHFCGGYRFDNPNLSKQEYVILNYIFKNEKKSNSVATSLKANNNYDEFFAKQILHLEDKIKTPLETIVKTLKEKNAFIGEDRIWFITTEKHY